MLPLPQENLHVPTGIFPAQRRDVVLRTALKNQSAMAGISVPCAAPDFLKATLDLPAEDYEEVTLVDPHLAREHLEDKLGILDVKVKTRSGKRIDIEIQVLRTALKNPKTWIQSGVSAVRSTRLGREMIIM